MAVPPDRLYGIGERFRLFPNPKLEKIGFASAWPAGEEFANFPKPIHTEPVSCSSEVNIRVPFTAVPLQFGMEVSSPFPGVDAVDLPEDILLFRAGIDAFKLEQWGLGSSILNGNRLNPIYTPEQKDRLERVVLVVYDQDKSSLLVPKVEDGQYIGMKYDRYTPFEDFRKPTLRDLSEFKKRIKHSDLFTVERDEKLISLLEGAFFTV